MTASLWLVAALACASSARPSEPAASNPAQDARGQAESVPPPRPAASKITDVTVYQGQALVTREVSVPGGGRDGRAGRHPAAGADRRQLALHRGGRRPARAQHPVPDPRRQGRHATGGPGQGRAAQEAPGRRPEAPEGDRRPAGGPRSTSRNSRVSPARRSRA